MRRHWAVSPHHTSRPFWLCLVPYLLLWIIAAIALPPATSLAREFDEPLVARAPMRFTVEDKVIDEIDKGDLLTVLEEREDAYVVTTFNGKRGLVSKANVVRLAESVDLYDELIESSPEEGRLYTLRASAWWARGEQKKALEDFDKAIEAGYRKPHAYSSRGLFHATLGNHEKAIADFTKAIEQGAKDASPYVNRAAVFMTQQKYDKAVADYEKAATIDPRNSSIYQQRAVAWKLAGKLEKAVADFGKAIELKPKNVAAWMGRGFMWFQQQEYQKAVDDFSAAIKIAPDLPQAYNNRGYNRQMLGKLADALADYDRAIELAPKYALAYQNKAWLLSSCSDPKLRNGKKAIQAATTACELSKYQDLGAVKALAASLAEDGQYDKAIGWQEKVLESTPEDQLAEERATLEKYQAGQPFRLAKAETDEE